MSRKDAPQAFLSYRRQVDEHDASRITKLRDRLQGEIRAQTDLDVEIFQDIRKLNWGDDWRDEVLDAAAGAYFLIPIITPGYFGSTPCREEYEAFKKHAAKRKTDSVILPIYYIDTDELEDAAWREGNDWAIDLVNKQWVDWRQLRLEPWELPEPHKRVESMAKDFKQRLKALGVLKPAHVVARALARQDERTATSAERPAPQTEEKSPSTPPPPRRRELIVSQDGTGQFRTVTDAVRAAGADDVILVKPGTYREGIVIDKSLTVLGDGKREEIIIEGQDNNALLFKAPFGRVANLTLRNAGQRKRFTVNIAEGRLELDGCDISPATLSCVMIQGQADPLIRRNRIHDGAEAGIVVSGRGTIEDNDVVGNKSAGVVICDNGDPVVRRNRIHDNAQSGLFLYDDAHGTVEDNEIYDNRFEGIEVKGNAVPIMRRNVVTRNRGGIRVFENGRGTYDDNDLRGNDNKPWILTKEGEAAITRSGNIEK